MKARKERLRARPWLLLVGLRSRLGFYRVGLQGRPRYYGSWLGLGVGVSGVVGIPIRPSLGIASAAAGVVISGVLLWPEWTGVRRGKVLVEEVQGFRLKNVRTSVGHLVEHPVRRGEFALVQDDVDRELRTSRATYDVARLRVPLTDKVSGHALDILSERVTKKNVYNGKIVRQNVDLTAEMLRQDAELSLSETDYFSMLCSNYMTAWRIRHRSTGALLLDGRSLVLDEEQSVIPLSSSDLANGIGVSTLGFTSDNKLVMTRQHRLAQSSAGLWAPAGSGSLDASDVKDARRRGEDTLGELLARGMRRELCEECNISPGDLGHTELTGYFRWLNQGGKPEYTGITSINLPAQALHGRQVRIVETSYVREIEADSAVDLSKLVRSPDRLSALQPRYRDCCSIPLFMSLRNLGRALQREAAGSDRLSRMVGMDRTDT